jgi:rhodanese-related sulfurtransferase
MGSLTPSELKTRLQNGGEPPVLVDVREAWEYAICHIDGSIHIPMAEISGALDDLDLDAETVLICHHGIRSQEIADFLAANGFTRVYNLEGGIDAWAKTIDPDMKQY